MRLAAFALATASLAAADPAAAPAAAPVRLDLQAFEQPMSAAGWRFYAWSRPLDPIPAAVAEVDGGKAVRLTAIDAGAIGVSSKQYRLDAADTGWRVTFRVKGVDGYANNTPWVFIAAGDKDGKFLPPAVNLGPAVKVTGEWTTATVEVARSKLPAGTEKLGFNVATAAVKEKTPAGALLIDDVQIDALR